jgi:L-arabonate dehydrase
VQDGDMIGLDVEARRIYLDVSQQELERRKAGWKPRQNNTDGGYQQLYVEHVMQANTGADFDFLTGCRGHAVPRESH